MADVNECFKVMWLKETPNLPDMIVDDLAAAADSDGILCYDEYIKLDETVAPFLEKFLDTPQRRFNDLSDTASDRESDALDKSEFESVGKLVEKGNFSDAAAAASEIDESELKLSALEIIGEGLAKFETRLISESIVAMAGVTDKADLEEIFSVLVREMLEKGRRIDVRDVTLGLPTADMRDAWRKELATTLLMYYLNYDEARFVAAEVEDEALRESLLEQIDRSQKRSTRIDD